ncbi:MAG: PEP-CTERM/exosortase system-associated acyltransferase, partial [Deltaproteobacteria bacterium]|nr:PEP-CTERM/exosortase system-associated acyltransferase [Deltaproteobacteria bacterium]
MFTMGRFKFVRVDSPEMKERIYRLRYEIFAREFGFENPEELPDGLEKDVYEPYAIHYAAMDETDEIVGTVRLIRHSENGFPIEHATKIEIPGKKPDMDKVAEVSRLAVHKTYRRRKLDGFYGLESYLTVSEGGIRPDYGPMPPALQKRKTPVIIKGLYKMVYQESKKMGLTHLLMIVEQKLYNSLKKFGFYIRQIGEAVEYHGVRIPCVAIIEEMDRHLMAEHQDMY